MSYHSQHGADSPANCWIYPRTPSFQMAFRHNHFADILGITVAETNGCIKCIEKGGTGVKTDDKWKANPAPYNKQIDLSAMTGNSLNLHVTRKAKGEPNTIPVPSVVTLDKNTQFVWLGKNRVQNNNGITPKIQIEIVKYVIGTHQTLIQSYPDCLVTLMKRMERLMMMMCVDD